MTNATWMRLAPLALLLSMLWSGPAQAQPPRTGMISAADERQGAALGPAPTPGEVSARSVAEALNVAGFLLAGFLALVLKAGFALMETGLIRAKNVAHTVAMNFGVYAIGMLGFWAVGFALMFGGSPGVHGSMGSAGFLGRTWDLIGLRGFFLAGGAGEAGILTLFFFHAAMLDTAATIPTGAMAERWKYAAFVAYGLFASTLIFPVYGCWTWGGGWLADLGVNFGLGSGHVDFAGSSVVHMTGGFMALAGAVVLGPRIGKYDRNGSANAIPGHNVPMVAVGTLILAFGWLGLNTGRGFQAGDLRVASIAVCTLLATASGCLAALATMWGLFGKPDPTMSCNGLLAGAVAISAPCAYVNPIGAVVIGALAGILVVASILFIDKYLKVDDPVGAISVHGVCGAFGCLGVGLFATGEYGAGTNGIALAPIGLFHGGGFDQLLAQIIGVATNILWVVPASLVGFLAVERLIGNRVSARAEIEGLDVPEMGVLGYVDEDTYAVQTAGQDFLATFGPGVPAKGADRSGLGGPKAGGSK